MFNINNTSVGKEFPTYFIAEIGSNFNGDLVKAKELIELAVDCGADAVKFQHYTASTLVSKAGFAKLRSNLSHQKKWKSSVFETYEKASLNPDWTGELAEYSRQLGITFITSPYSFELADLSDKFVPVFKIGSGDISYLDLVEHISKKNKPIILATGASSLEEVDGAVNTILKNNSSLCLMQCNTNYENTLNNFSFLNLRALTQFQQRYSNVVLGLSDHTQGHVAVLGAVALGARIIEKHFTDDCLNDGPDHAFAMDPNAWRRMIKDTRILEESLGDGYKKIESNECDARIVQRRSICMRKDLPEGYVLKESDLTFLRPLLKDAYHPYQKGDVIGRKLTKKMYKGEVLLSEYHEDQ